MKVNDWAIVFATFAGPVFAVLATVWLDGYRRRRDRREGIALALLNSLPSDPGFQAAINAIQLVFPNDKDVIDKWDDYITAAAAQKTGDNHIPALQLSVLKAIGFRNDRAAKTVRSRMLTNGYLQALEKQNQALDAVARIATAAERSANATEQLIARTGTPV